MEHVLDVVKGITLFLLITILSIHTIIELLDSIGWLPEWLRNRLHERRKAMVVETLAAAGITSSSSHELIRATIVEMGIEDRPRWIRSVDHVLDISTQYALPDAHPNLKKDLAQIVKRYIEQGNFVIGSNSKREVRFFVNLRHAFCASPDDLELDKRLAEIMLAYIRECFKNQGLATDAIVARKSGLNTLAYLVARAMGKPLLLYTEDASVWSKRSNGKNNGLQKNRPRHLDYLLPEKTTAIIVDDSCVGGNSFSDLADDLRRHQINISHAFVLFSRKEVDAARRLRAKEIKLHTLDTYSDADLETMLGQQGSETNGI